jgi:hypothetical protein
MKVEGRKPFVGEGGEVHWPMLVFYPEGAQQDVVEDCCEGDTFQQHLDVVGGACAAGACIWGWVPGPGPRGRPPLAGRC